MRSLLAVVTRRPGHQGLGMLLALLLLLALALPAQAAPVKNVILLIPDGCSAEQYTLTRWVKGAPLAQDAILVGGVRTFIADSVVADSAPAATAYACGLRSADKLIGVAPPDQDMLPGQASPAGQGYRPLATVLEAARLKGKSTGLVATSRITHATPAAFAAHVSHRDQEVAIAKQMAHQGLTVFLGGGRKNFLPKTAGGAREDGLDLLAQLRAQGYQTPQNRDELLKIKGGRVAGLFAASHLKADRERAALAPGEPSLAEMTGTALMVLSQNPQGFFLMVEGSQIDWACHANDPGHLVGDMLAYDQAFAVALDFARRHPGTLLIAMSDHNTGGLSLGNYSTDKTYPQLKIPALREPLMKMKVKASTLWESLGPDPTPERIQEGVRRDWGMEISAEEAQRILAVAARYPKSPEYGLGQVLSAQHTYVGWTTHGHCGGDVPLFAYGPGKPSGLLEAPQVALTVAKALGVDLRRLDGRLHAPAALALPGAQLSEEQTPQGWRLKVRAGGRAASLADGDNRLSLDGREIALEAPVVRVEQTGQWYLPSQAGRLLLAGPQAPKTKAAR